MRSTNGIAVWLPGHKAGRSAEEALSRLWRPLAERLPRAATGLAKAERRAFRALSRAVSGAAGLWGPKPHDDLPYGPHGVGLVCALDKASAAVADRLARQWGCHLLGADEPPTQEACERAILYWLGVSCAE